MSINKVILIGRLTNDIEVKSTFQGLLIGRFSLAVNEYSKNKEYVSFINCVAFGKIVEIMQQYTKKGVLIGVEGYLKQQRWTDNQTNKNFSKIEVMINRLELLQSRDRQNDNNNQNVVQNNQQSDNLYDYDNKNNSYSSSYSNDTGFEESGEMEDIPF